MVSFRFLAAFFGLTAWCIAPVLAQQTAANPDEIVVRTYNVADLVRATTNYPLNPSPVQSSGGGGGTLFGGQRQAQQGLPPPQIDELLELLMDTVDRESWRERGGTIGGMRVTGSLLIVQNTRKNQDLIQQILNDIRRTGGPAQVVTVRLTWVQTNARELLKPTSEVTPEWVEKQKAYCESQITCFSGQTVHQLSGKDDNYISDLTPIVGTNAVAFDPSMSTARSGVAMQISPQLVPDLDSVILDVQAHVTESVVKDVPSQVMSVSIPSTSPMQTTANVNRVNIVNQQFKTTARVPLRKKVIIGGMTLEPANADQAGRQLYLVVEMDTVN